MKKTINFKNIFLIIAILFAGLNFAGCKKEKIYDYKSNQNDSNHLNITRYGIAHNLFLSNVKDNFMADENITNIDECLEFISSHNKEFSHTIGLFNEDEIYLLTNYFDKYQFFYISNILYDSAYNDFYLVSQINFLRNERCITENDRKLLIHLLEACNKQFTGELSVYKYCQQVKQLESEWKRCFKEGTVSDYSAIIINIASNSAQWWLENNEETKVAPWVASDAVGAAWGATVAGVTSYCQSGKVNWVGVGVAAVSGAVTGSTGVVGKVGKWISKVVK